jgi:hypothetical protein
VLPGAQVLDWRQDAGGHTGRMVADGLVYRWRVDGDGVAYRPAWDGVRQRGWELRSDSFLELRAPGARMDFRRGSSKPASGKKRECSTGYGCGAACISLQKECRINPGSAIGKNRLRRLQQLAATGDKRAETTATALSASRGALAAERLRDRNAKRVEQLLARPEIAEFLRTGKLPQGASTSTEPGTVRNLSPGKIVFDPGRFQYKLNATEGTGEVGSLSGVRKWDPNLAGVMSVWKDPADGRIYVVNGHNRLSLAKRLGAEDVTVRFLTAANATDARAIGAMQNIAEGAGTPMDAAKFFRDTGIKTQKDVEARGLPLGSGQAEKGLRLSKLPGSVFNAVVRGDLSVNRGAIIGGSGLDEVKQREVYRMVSARKNIADQTLQELVEHAAASEQRTQTTLDLFGMSQEAKDNLFTRAKLSAGLKAKIAREKRLFGAVSKAKAATSLQEKGGNVINQEQSSKVASEASEALNVFNRLKSSSGPISSALNRAADRLEAGESESKVRQDLERDVFAAVEQELTSAGLRKRPRADSLEARIDALRRKCSTGYGCGSACISLRKECRTSPSSSIGKQRLKRLLAIAAGEGPGQRGIAPVNAKEAGELAAGIGKQRGAKAAQLRMVRQISAEAPNMTPREQRLVDLAKKQLTGAGPERAAPKPQKPYTPTPQIHSGISSKPMSFNPGGDSEYEPAAESAKAKGGLKYSRTQRGGLTKQNYVFRDRQAAEHWYADDNAKSDADAEFGASNRRGKEWQSEYKAAYASYRNLLRSVGDRELLETVQAFAAAGKATRGGTATDVRIGGNKFSRPIREGTFASKAPTQSPKAAASPGDFGLTNPSPQTPGQAPKPKEQGLTTQDVTTSSQQAAFARQQQQAARAAGDERGAQAWRQEERTVERNRLANAITTRNQSQTALFGATEYDQSMPLLQQQPAGAVEPRQTPKIADVLRQTTAQLKAADARQMGMIAEQLFETSWTIDRRTRFRGMSKDQARDQFKADFLKQMREQAASPEAAERAAAMRDRVAASGSVSGAMKAVLEAMQAQDKRLENLQREAIDLRLQAEEQFGDQGADPTLGGGRPRRRLGGSKRRDGVADSLEGRISALRMHFAPLSR